MVKLSLAALLLLSTSEVRAAVREPKVLMVVVDGIRALELRDLAKDDQGKPVRARELMPNLTAFRDKGAYFPEMQISNPAGVSLPAYADILTGARQTAVVSNSPSKKDARPQTPTIFDTLKSQLKLDSKAMSLMSSWDPICQLGSMDPDENEFYRSCGWKNGAHKGEYFKLELYEGSRTDTDTFVEFMQEIPKRHPRFMFLHLVDADEEAHFHEGIKNKAGVHYGIFNYHKALREDDYYVGRIWQALQADPFYKDSTYLIVTTDHGRDNWPDPAQWHAHGECKKKHGAKELCSGCRQVFAIVMGPGIRKQVSKTRYTHLDLAPTAAALMGAQMSTAQGKPISEVVSSQKH